MILAISALGALLLCDKPGLRAEYFHLADPWTGNPVYTATKLPGLEEVEYIHEVLRTEVAFSVRWNGWWYVHEGGNHTLTLDANDRGYLAIDGETILDTKRPPRGRRKRAQVDLQPGFHAVEVGLAQAYGRSHLAIEWAAPGANSLAALPEVDLYSQRPLRLRRLARTSLASWSNTYRRLLGFGLLLIGVFLTSVFFGRLLSEKFAITPVIRARFGSRPVRLALLLLLFIFSFLAIFPFTGTVRGGDDTAYLVAAKFSEKNWFFSRYAHVHLLSAFTSGAGGNPFLGVRLWWSFVFAATVAAMAMAVKSVGPGLQLRTLAAALFVLLAQPVVFGTIGSGFADYTAMMFITAAVATYMHGIALERRGSRRHEWHALAIGVLTIGAFRSKEVGAILLLLPVLFLFTNGRLNLRRFVRKVAYWTGGVGATFLILMSIDAWILGDFWFSFPGGSVIETGPMNFPAGLGTRAESDSWLNVVWSAAGHAAGLALRYLWIGVVAAALAAGLRRKRIELRLLHFLPLVYLLALIVLYFRMRHPFSPRMLIPIIPTASVMTALLLYHAGIEDLSWRQIIAPRVLAILGSAASVLFLIVVPYRLARLDGNEFLPMEQIARFGWSADLFLNGTLLPAAIIIAICSLALVINRPRARVVALVVAFLVFFAPGFEHNRYSMASRQAAQTGELLQYPWRVFGPQINEVPSSTIHITTDLLARYRMSALTKGSLAALTLGRRDVHVSMSRELRPDADVAIASRFLYDRWKRAYPELTETAEFDPSGVLVFMRPRQTLAGRDDDGLSP